MFIEILALELFVAATIAPSYLVAQARGGIGWSILGYLAGLFATFAIGAIHIYVDRLVLGLGLQAFTFSRWFGSHLFGPSPSIEWLLPGIGLWLGHRARTKSSPGTINGIGTTYMGRRERRHDGSCVTTEFFVVYFFPVFPLRSWRVRFQSAAQSRGWFNWSDTAFYDQVEAVPLNMLQVANVYIGSAALVALLAYGFSGIALGLALALALPLWGAVVRPSAQLLGR
jgi:hypothetical protein